jgi:exodeoxyribonuclease VII large subunit
VCIKIKLWHYSLIPCCFNKIVRHLEPVGVGNLQAAFEQLKTKLRDKGLFDAKHKKPLPTKVDTIGVISSSNGAVIRDIIKDLPSFIL